MTKAFEADIITEIQHWHQEHKQATWSEVEAEVDRRLQAVHQSVMQAVTTEDDLSPEIPCPTCQHPMRAVGKRTRQVQSQRGPQVPLLRTYFVCPVCETGLFPPG